MTSINSLHEGIWSGVIRQEDFAKDTKHYIGLQNTAKYYIRMQNTAKYLIRLQITENYFISLQNPE